MTTLSVRSSSPQPRLGSSHGAVHPSAANAASAAPVQHTQSLEAALALVTRSTAESSALAILRRAPRDRSPADVHEAYSWIMSAHPRLFSEFGGAASSSVVRAAEAGRALTARLRYAAFAKREMLFQQADPADAVYMLIRGSVSIWALPADTFAGKHENPVASTAAAAASVSPTTVQSAVSPSAPVRALVTTLSPPPTASAPAQRHSFSNATGALALHLASPPTHGRRASLNRVMGSANDAAASAQVSSTAAAAVAAAAIAMPPAAASMLSPHRSASPGGMRIAHHSRNNSRGGAGGSGTIAIPENSNSSSGTASPKISPAVSSSLAMPSPSLPSAVQPADNPLYIRNRANKTLTVREQSDAPPVPLALLSRAQSLGMEPWKLRMGLIGSLRVGGVKTTFGEQGLLQSGGGGGGAANANAPAGAGTRSATIRAEESPTEVLWLGRSDFEQLLQQNYHKDLSEKFASLSKMQIFQSLIRGNHQAQAAQAAQPTPLGAPVGSSAAPVSTSAAANAAANAASPHVGAVSSSPPAKLSSRRLTNSSGQAGTTGNSGNKTSSSSSAASKRASMRRRSSAAATARQASVSSTPEQTTPVLLSSPSMDALNLDAASSSSFGTPVGGGEIEVNEQPKRGTSDASTSSAVAAASASTAVAAAPVPSPAAPASSEQSTAALSYLRKLALFFESRTYAPRATIVHQGDPATMVYAVVKGEVEMVHGLRVGRRKVSEEGGDEVSSAERGSHSILGHTSSHQILLGLLGPGHCFGELDHLPPARGAHPLGLRAGPSPSGVTLLVIGRDDWAKRVLGVVLDRSALRKLRARDAWRAQRIEDIEARGVVGHMLLAASPSSGGKFQHASFMAHARRQMTQSLSGAALNIGSASARGAASTASSSSPSRKAVASGSMSARTPQPISSSSSSARKVLNPSGQSGWQSIRDLGEVALVPEEGSQLQQQRAGGKGRPRRTDQAQMSPSTSAADFPSLHAPRTKHVAHDATSALPLGFSLSVPFLSAASSSSSLLSPSASSSGLPASASASSAAAAVGGPSYAEVVERTPARLVSPSASTARLLQMHRSSQPTLGVPGAVATSSGASTAREPSLSASPSSLAISPAPPSAMPAGAVEEQKDSWSAAGSKNLLGGRITGPMSLSRGGVLSAAASAATLPSATSGQLQPAAPMQPSSQQQQSAFDPPPPPASLLVCSAPAPLPAALALGRELAAPLSLRALDEARSALRRRDARVAAMARAEQRASAEVKVSRYKIGVYTAAHTVVGAGGGRAARISAASLQQQQNMAELARLGVLLPRKTAPATSGSTAPGRAMHSTGTKLASGEEVEPLPDVFVVDG